MENDVLLTKVNSLTEAKMFVEILKDNGIPSYYKNNSALQILEHLAADTNQEQLVYVLAKDYEKASELLSAFVASDNALTIYEI